MGVCDAWSSRLAVHVDTNQVYTYGRPHVPNILLVGSSDTNICIISIPIGQSFQELNIIVNKIEKKDCLQHSSIRCIYISCTRKYNSFLENSFLEKLHSVVNPEMSVIYYSSFYRHIYKWHTCTVFIYLDSR